MATQFNWQHEHECMALVETNEIVGKQRCGAAIACQDPVCCDMYHSDDLKLWLCLEHREGCEVDLFDIFPLKES